MKKTLTWAAFFLLALNAIVFAADDPATPRYELGKGNAFQYLLTVATDIRQQNEDISVPRHEKWQIHYNIKVTGPKSDNGIPLTVTIGAIHYELATPFEHYTDDLKATDKELAPNLLPYAQMVGTDFKVNLNNRVVIDPDSINIHQTEKDDLPWSYPNTDFIFVQRSFPALINNIFPAYPDTAGLMQKDATWEKALTFQNGRSAIPATLLYRINEINPSTYTLGITGPCTLKAKRALSVKRHSNGSSYTVSEGEIEATPDEDLSDGTQQPKFSGNSESLSGNPVDTFSEKLTAELNGQATGSLMIDQKTGLPLNGDIQLVLTGEVVRFKTKIPTNITIKIHYQKIK